MWTVTQIFWALRASAYCLLGCPQRQQCLPLGEVQFMERCHSCSQLQRFIGVKVATLWYSSGSKSLFLFTGTLKFFIQRLFSLRRAHTTFNLYALGISGSPRLSWKIGWCSSLGYSILLLRHNYEVEIVFLTPWLTCSSFKIQYYWL